MPSEVELTTSGSPHRLQLAAVAKFTKPHCAHLREDISFSCRQRKIQKECLWLLRLFFWTSTAWSMQGGYFLANDRIVWSFVNIDLCPVSVVFRDVGIREDGFHRTLRDASIAINASVGINVEAIGQFMKSFDRAHGRTVGIFAVNAQLNNYIGHW
jgi:hypothetical protein